MLEISVSLFPGAVLWIMDFDKQNSANRSSQLREQIETNMYFTIH